MMVARLGFVIAVLALFGAAPALAIPTTDKGGQVATIPFDPPLGEPLRYRWESTIEKDGESTVSWSVDEMTFAAGEEGYRLTVTPVSSGSNDNDPRKAAFMKEVEDLTKLPVVIIIDGEARIAGVEREEEYWQRATGALRAMLRNEAKTDEQRQFLERLVSIFDSMPAEARRARLTESVQPLVEFALTETTVGKPIITQSEVASPYGGTIKREITISLTKVDTDFAWLTIRSRIPGSEIERMTRQFFDRMGINPKDKADAAKRDEAMAAIRQMRMDAVADYQVALADGMLESFRSTETISVVVDGKQSGRVAAKSLTRVY